MRGVPRTLRLLLVILTWTLEISAREPDTNKYELFVQERVQSTEAIWQQKCGNPKYAETTEVAEATAEARGKTMAESAFINGQSSGAAAANAGQSATAATRLSGAFNTDVKGDVEAGVEFAPLALARVPIDIFNWTVQLAALKDSKVRVGTGVSLVGANSQDYSDLICQGDLAALRSRARQALYQMQSSVEALCMARGRLHAPLSELDAFCSLEDPDLDHLSLTLSAIEELSETERARLGENLAVEALEATETQLIDSSIGFDETKFLGMYRNRMYDSPRLRFGVDSSFDFDSLKRGTPREELNENDAGVEVVEEEEFPSGELQRWTVGPAATFNIQRFSTTMGMRFGELTPVAHDERVGVFVPSAEVNFVLAFLVDDFRKKLKADGKLPPRITIGAKGSAEVVRNRPEFQQGSLNQAKVMAYADFFVTDKLSFRLGVPVEGKLVEQEEKEQMVNGASEVVIPKRTVLQWTMPVSIVTAVSL